MAVVLDEETERWLVPPPLRGELDRIKFEYHAVPLPVYVNDKFVEPVNVNSCYDKDLQTDFYLLLGVLILES